SASATRAGLPRATPIVARLRPGVAIWPRARQARQAPPPPWPPARQRPRGAQRRPTPPAPARPRQRPRDTRRGRATPRPRPRVESMPLTPKQPGPAPEIGRERNTRAAPKPPRIDRKCAATGRRAGLDTGPPSDPAAVATALACAAAAGSEAAAGVGGARRRPPTADIDRATMRANDDSDRFTECARQWASPMGDRDFPVLQSGGGRSLHAPGGATMAARVRRCRGGAAPRRHP